MIRADRDAGVTRLVARAGLDLQRLDQFLASATELSRRRSRQLISDGLVWRNGEPVRIQSRPLEPGDVIDVLLPEDQLGALSGRAVEPVEILHEDGWILVANKPAGVLSQPAERQRSGELAFDERVLVHLALRDGRRPFLRAAHRLDRATSGTMLFTRRPAATAPIDSVFRSGRVDRWYLAVVEGDPGWSRRILDGPIGRDHTHRWRFRVTPGGRAAATEIHVLSALGRGLTLVACRLTSGRTHQVRVHLASEGHPVHGDSLYGSCADRSTTRPLLHAARLSLPHPAHGDRVVVSAPLPADLDALIPRGLEPEGLIDAIGEGAA